MKIIIVFFIALSLLTGCNPPNNVAKATETSRPTIQSVTEIPTQTASIVPSKTATHLHTLTPTPVLSPTPTLSPTPVPTRWIEKGASIVFSYLPPENWTRKLLVGNISGWSGPDQAVLAFQEHRDSKSAHDAANYWIPRMMPNTEFEILSEGPFKTNADMDAYKVTIWYLSDIDKKQRSAETYFFRSNGHLIQASFLRYWNSHPEFDALIDTQMTTFMFTNE